MYFSPATRKPLLCIFLTSDVSEYEAMISFISAGDTWTNRQSSSSASQFLPHATSSSEYMYGRSRNGRHTVKPGDEAQTLVPCVLKIAALSKCPVPTKLQNVASAFEIENTLSYARIPLINICLNCGSASLWHRVGRLTDLATTYSITRQVLDARDERLLCAEVVKLGLIKVVLNW